VKRLALIAAGLFIGLAAASSAFAQDSAEDWDLTVDPTRQLTLASLDFGNNALVLRCQAGVLDFLVTGTPVSTESARTVRVSAGGIANETQRWQTQPGLPVLSASEPDRLARQLRAGGDLDVRIEPAAAGERPMRFRLNLPASAGSLDRALSACGASLADEWDLRPRAAGGLTWAQQVLPEYPEAAATRDIGLASVRLACIVPANGRLEECRVLYEAPDGLGFGRNALVAARNSSVALPAGDLSDVGKVVTFSMRFRSPEN
jgi:TonB family protein